MKSLQTYTFWFVVGSQDLYGEDVLKTVDAHTKEMSTNGTRMPPFPVKSYGRVLCAIRRKSIRR